jgi:predicted anti-sigma-YlaC factor YlaD
MTKSAECISLLESLSDYLDGTLNEEFCEEIQRHVAECQNCQIVLDTLRKTVYLYHATASEPAAVPLNVRDRLFRSLNLEDYLKH